MNETRLKMLKFIRLIKGFSVKDLEIIQLILDTDWKLKLIDLELKRRKND